MTTEVHAVIPAFGRPQLLKRALASLANQDSLLASAFVINNSLDAEINRIAAEAHVRTTVLQPKCNLGTAGGIAFGMYHALQQHTATHVWVLDDDACATPGALVAMCDALADGHADCVAPLITDETGRVRWFPGPLQQPAWDVVRQNPTPEEFLARCGNNMCSWNWAIWASIVISRRAIEAVGYPRMDLWSQYSDLEYTLRISSRFRCVLAPSAVCQHLPAREPTGPSRAKLYSALQSANYVSVRLPHGWRGLRHLPGLNYRYLRHFRWRPRAWWDLASAFVRGAILGLTPAQCEERSSFKHASATFVEWNRLPKRH